MGLMFDVNLTEHLSLALKRFPRVRVEGKRRGPRYRPCGVASLQNAIGLDPCVVGKYPIRREVAKFVSTPTCFFAHLMLAMSEHRNQVKWLYTDGTQIDQIDMEKLLSVPSRSTLGHLRALDLNIVEPRETTSDRDLYGTMHNPRSPPKSCTLFEHSVAVMPVVNELGGLGEGIVQVLGAAPQIEELTLTMWPDKRFRTARAGDSLRRGRTSNPDRLSLGSLQSSRQGSIIYEPDEFEIGQHLDHCGSASQLPMFQCADPQRPSTCICQAHSGNDWPFRGAVASTLKNRFFDLGERVPEVIIHPFPLY
jgi:hypothetical protein